MSFVPSPHARGRLAETYTANRLVSLGYAIVDRNVRVGRLEIDLVARSGGLLAFVEVRARTTLEHGHPGETIDGRKRARVRRAAAGWLAAHPSVAAEVRFDAACVVFDREGRIRAWHYYPGAF